MTLDPHPSEPIVLDSRAPRPTLLAFCHLRWRFVFQRPQHLLTRLAAHFDVIVVEEPVRGEGPARFATAHAAPGVEVLTPHTPAAAPGFCDEQLRLIAGPLQDFLAARGIAEPLVWLYTPMALPLLDLLEPAAIVYDCMDDLASFKFAPAELVERERALLELADLVLAGGPSLHESRRRLRPDVHCLPSAVDVEHFAPANLHEGSAAALVAQTLHAGLTLPRIGFFGVIDERLDLGLVEAVADARPDWQLVMVGPVVKIDPASLPQRPNIRWIGMQDYETLPYLLAHWDVAILPFALNEATRFISPTKTLEYLAGGVPVVSTPIHDVAALYGSVVRIAAGAAAFVDAIEATLNEPAEARAAREQDARAIIARSTWDVAAARVLAWLQPYVAARPAARIEPAMPSLRERLEAGLPVLVPDEAGRSHVLESMPLPR
jgi:UDP-galactopyranose mutase